jgi:hypothetical protein
MSVLNFVMFGMSGVVIYMDALSNKIYGGWRIWMPETGLGVQPLTVQECSKFLFEEKKEAEQVQVQEVKVINQSKQLTLF